MDSFELNKILGAVFASCIVVLATSFGAQALFSPKLPEKPGFEIAVKEAAPQLAQRLKAEVIQVIGRTLTLYRHNPAIVRREGDAPPWKR